MFSENLQPVDNVVPKKLVPTDSGRLSTKLLGETTQRLGVVAKIRGASTKNQGEIVLQSVDL